MSNLLVNRRDQEFLLYEQFGLEKIFVKKYADYSRETTDMMLNEAEKMAIEVILPTFEPADKEGCTFKDGQVFVPECYHEAYKKFREAGWICPTQDPEVGGQNLPISVLIACQELFVSASIPFTMYPGLNLGAGHLVEKYGTDEQKKKYLEKMYNGQWAGTMCLTEPGAGSDVGALKTTAKRLPDGTYSITGTKCFISSGDHNLTENIVHPVLARIEGDPPGTAGISIFLVPKYRVNADGSLGEFNDIRTGGIEHKLGIKGSATATLNFGDEGKCIGELLGNEREGMKIMFVMMNQARLDVGMQAMAVASAAYEHALDYAKTRVQGTPIWEMKNPDAQAVTIINHPDVRRMLLWMKAQLEGIRALNYFVANCMDRALVADTEAEKELWTGFADLLTPVCKAYSSEKGFEICNTAIDIYGGYGYCCEYPVEHYLRDAKITTIYEGTNGIQALTLVGRNLGQNKGANMMNLLGEIGKNMAGIKASEEMKAYAPYLQQAVDAITDLTLHFAALGQGGGFMIPILNARPYLETFGNALAGNFLLQAAVIASKKLKAMLEEKGLEDTPAKRRKLVRENSDAAFYVGKIDTAKFFATNVLAKVKASCESIKIGDKTALEMPEESFTC